MWEDEVPPDIRWHFSYRSVQYNSTKNGFEGRTTLHTLSAKAAKTVKLRQANIRAVRRELLDRGPNQLDKIQYRQSDATRWKSKLGPIAELFTA